MVKIIFLFALASATTIFSAEKSGEGTELIKLGKSFDIIAQGWEKTHDPVFLTQCLDAVQASESSGVKSDEFQSKIIDILSAMLAVGGVTGSKEFGGNGPPVRDCQFEALTTIASSIYFTSLGSAKWEENRDRLARNLMAVRLSWKLLRNPHWDNIVVEINNSTGTTGNMASDPNTFDIQLQEDLKKFLEESEPIFSKFLIGTYSRSIPDLMKLNEFMILGGYDGKERKVLLVQTASANNIKLPQSILVTLPQ